MKALQTKRTPPTPLPCRDVEAEFWHDRWSRGQIGFHQTSVSRSLAEVWPTLGIASHSRVFVPLCGKSLDLLWLRDRGHDVIGVELSEIAVEAFCLENGVRATRRQLLNFESFDDSSLQLLCGDFFGLTPSLLDGVSAVYDRAALISWAPAFRDGYVKHMTAITRGGTSVLLVVLEYAGQHVSGPPFSIGQSEIARLYSDAYSIRELARRDISEEDPRLRARATTPIIEICYLLERR